MTAYTISMDTIEPSFATEVINTGHSPFYHYHDCNCFTCQDNHRFYCGDTNCVYCMIVGTMLFTGEIESSSGAVSYSEFLTYDVEFFYKQLSNSYGTWKIRYEFVNTEYLVKYFCTECNDRIGYDTYKDQKDGKELCATCKESSVFYCSNGCGSEVDEDGDTCDYCSRIYCANCGEYEIDQEGDYCDYCQEEQNDHLYDGFTMGQILTEDEYEYTKDAWLSPNGDLHFVPCYNRYGVAHKETAVKLGFSGCSDIERKGYIHISSYYGDIWHAVPSRPTKAQIKTARLLCEAHGWELPEFAAYDELEEITEETVTCIPMQNLDPSWLRMNRKLRDMFYPLSGD